MVKFPDFLAKQNTDSYVDLDEFSFCAYNPLSGRERIRVLLTTNLLAFIIKGKKIIHHGEKEIHINEGEAFFAQKGFHLLSDRLNKANQYESFIFFLDDRLLTDFHKDYSDVFPFNSPCNTHLPVFKIPRIQQLKSSIISLPKLFQDYENNKKHLIKIRLQEIFIRLLESPCGREFSEVINSALDLRKKDLVQYMNENFLMHADLKDFARHTNRSLSSFKTDFSKAFNETPMAWIKEKRLQYAMTMLKNNDNSVTEICFEAGFGNQSHIIKSGVPQ
ncbi:MAG: AraC family transcriptional regulator [Spirochaetaceae bacterium]|jgi:AraC-like DNA-binding protein|nr:AraC family transcriptional regulator [Spirochaetaceae bacterium]